MEKTTNYKLFKPELGDRVSIGDINENMDILDEKLKEVELIKIDKSRILSTKEEVEAVTEEGFLVDALVAAQLNSDIKIKDCGTNSNNLGSSDIINVTFNKSFDVVPMIFCQAYVGTGFMTSINIRNVTTTGFSYSNPWDGSSTSATTTVFWIAI